MAAKKGKGKGKGPQKPRGGDKGGSKKPKTRGRALQDRLDQVSLWRGYGRSTAWILAECHARWGISETQAEEYLRRVDERWAEDSARTRAKARQAAIGRLYRLAMRAAERGRDDAVARYEVLLLRIEGTTFQPGDELRAQGDVAWVVKRNRNATVAPESEEEAA